MIRLRFERKRMVSRERKHTRKKETLSLNTLSCTARSTWNVTAKAKRKAKREAKSESKLRAGLVKYF